jgi:hypothetical protein
MRSSKAWKFLVVAGGIAIGACNSGGGGGTDAGGGGGDTGGGGGDAGGEMLPTLPMSSAPLTCAGMRTAPTGGSAVTVNMDLQSFGQNGDHAANVTVCLCGSNVFSMEALAAMAGGSCGMGCELRTTDMTGHASFTTAQAGGWYAYRVFAKTGPTMATTFLDSIQVNEDTPMSGGNVTANAVSALTANTISAAELITRAPGTVTMAGRVRDCMGNDLPNAIVRVFHANGTPILEGMDIGDPHYRYFDGMENPDANAMYTGADGLWLAANVTPNSPAELIRVEAYANTGSGTQRIGCEAVQAFADGVSIVNIGPLRSDYPAGHPCHP